MSCFVVGKASMAIAAGIVAGIADAANEGPHNDRFWLYSMEKNRNMTGTDYLEAFTKVHEMNCKSVSESWREEQKPEQDDHMDEFKKAYKLGKKLYRERWQNGAYLRVIQELREFFSSIRYQIDNPVLEKKVASFLNAVVVRLLAQLDTEEHESWGELELGTISQIMTEEETRVKLHVQRALGIETA